MRLGNVTAGSAFKTAALSLVVFVVVLAAAGTAIVVIVRAAMVQQLRAQVVEELSAFEEVYELEGRAGLVDFIDRSASIQTTRNRLVGLFVDDRGPIAGQLADLPGFRGWGTLSYTAPKTGLAGDYYVNARPIGDQVIVVGRNLDIVDRVVSALVWALAVSGCFVMLVSLAIGYVASRNAFRKLEGMAGTLDRVAHGDLGARLAVGRGNDQIDRVSRHINVHLERLADLTASMRNTTIAVAHDLRTPLNRAYLHIQTAAGESTDWATRIDALHAAEQELQRISTIFDTILRIARIESSAERSSFACIDLRDVAAEVVDAYRPVFEDRQQVLELQRTGGDARVHADRNMLLQLLANLLANANRHTPPRTRVTVAVLRQADQVALRVADDGPGIPAEGRADALEPFHRFAQDGEGTGLGLSLVRAIAERHGTDVILADNRPGLRVEVRFAAVPARRAAAAA